MLFSGTTKDFHKDFAKLPDFVQKRIIAHWAEWQGLAAAASRHAQKPKTLEERFDCSSQRIGLKELTARDGIYSCDLGSLYRALGRRFKDDSGKQRIVWFWAGTHRDYDKLTINNYINKIGARAELEHRQRHTSWQQKRKRVRISLAQLPILQRTEPKLQRSQSAAKPSAAQRRRLALVP